MEAEEGSPIGEEELNSNLPGLEKSNLKNFLNQNMKLIIGVGAGIAILIIIIIVIILSTGQKSSTGEALGTMECIYDIDITSRETQIIGNDFSKKFDISIKIDG